MNFENLRQILEDQAKREELEKYEIYFTELPENEDTKDGEEKPNPAPIPPLFQPQVITYPPWL